MKVMPITRKELDHKLGNKALDELLVLSQMAGFLPKRTRITAHSIEPYDAQQPSWHQGMCHPNSLDAMIGQLSKMCGFAYAQGYGLCDAETAIKALKQQVDPTFILNLGGASSLRAFRVNEAKINMHLALCENLIKEVRREVPETKIVILGASLHCVLVMPQTVDMLNIGAAVFANRDENRRSVAFVNVQNVGQHDDDWYSYSYLQPRAIATLSQRIHSALNDLKRAKGQDKLTAAADAVAQLMHLGPQALLDEISARFDFIDDDPEYAKTLQLGQMTDAGGFSVGVTGASFRQAKWLARYWKTAVELSHLGSPHMLVETLLSGGVPLAIVPPLAALLIKDCDLEDPIKHAADTPQPDQRESVKVLTPVGA